MKPINKTKPAHHKSDGQVKFITRPQIIAKNLIALNVDLQNTVYYLGDGTAIAHTQAHREALTIIKGNLSYLKAIQKYSGLKTAPIVVTECRFGTETKFSSF